jgi:hypothetical protein
MRGKSNVPCHLVFQTPRGPVSRGRQTGRKEANESSKTCLYFACSGYRIRNNCLGECHNEHTRNWKESRVSFKRAISRDGPSFIEPCGVGMVCVAGVADVTSRENSGNISLPRFVCGSRVLFLPESDSPGVWASAGLSTVSRAIDGPWQSHSSFVFCCVSSTDAPSAQPSRRSSWEILPLPAYLHFYAPNIDAPYAQAVRAGAIP